jgi:hypothetical protein
MNEERSIQKKGKMQTRLRIAVTIVGTIPVLDLIGMASPHSPSKKRRFLELANIMTVTTAMNAKNTKDTAEAYPKRLFMKPCLKM